MKAMAPISPMIAMVTGEMPEDTTSAKASARMEDEGNPPTDGRAGGQNSGSCFVVRSLVRFCESAMMRTVASCLATGDDKEARGQSYRRLVCAQGYWSPCAGHFATVICSWVWAGAASVSREELRKTFSWWCFSSKLSRCLRCRLVPGVG